MDGPGGMGDRPTARRTKPNSVYVCVYLGFYVCGRMNVDTSVRMLEGSKNRTKFDVDNNDDDGL